MLGHYNYFGVNGNMPSLNRYQEIVKSQWWRWLRRRGQRAKMSSKRYAQLLQRYPIPEPRICISIWG
jgi:hypothetical protein